MSVAKKSDSRGFPCSSATRLWFVIGRLRLLESPHRLTLVELAKRTASAVWGIPVEQLDTEISEVYLGI